MHMPATTPPAIPGYRKGQHQFKIARSLHDSILHPRPNIKKSTRKEAQSTCAAKGKNEKGRKLQTFSNCNIQK